METLKSITAKKKGLKMTNKLKPFDLQATLKGEPVMLRDGSKAFVRHHETEQEVRDDFRLWGVVAVEGGSAIALQWSTQGKWCYEGGEHDYDIIGMYPKTRIINGFEVPAPETQVPEDGIAYYIPILHTVNLYGADVWYRDEKWHERYLKRGLVFLNKEDVIANAKAMLGINPYAE